MTLTGADTRMDLSILIPCYNEQAVIARTVNDYIESFRSVDFSFEILCVNNASTDMTERVLGELVLQYGPVVRYVNTPEIPGYGIAVRWGLEHYQGRSVVIVMADGSESPEDIINFYQMIREGYDCAFGSRFVSGATVEGYPRFKLLVNRLGNQLISWVTGMSYNDFSNGFKCYRREVIDSMKPLISEQFNLTIEMSMGAVMSGFSFAVVPNSWKDRSAGTSKFRVVSQSKMYLMTLAYCWLRAKIRGKSWRLFQKALAETASFPANVGSNTDAG